MLPSTTATSTATTEGGKSQLIASYSPNDQSYETRPRRDSELADGLLRQSSAQLTDRLIGSATIETTATAITTTANPKATYRGLNKASQCLLTCLLGATLLASILNTLLLSFVVKSIQLNDKGFINGNLTWDEQIQATVFELPAKLAGSKSISLQSIKQSFNQNEADVNDDSDDLKPLKIEFCSTARSSSNDEKSYKANVNHYQPSHEPFMTGQTTLEGSKSNYMALNLNTYAGSNNFSSIYNAQPIGTLEIGTKSLEWNLLIEEGQRTNHSAKSKRAEMRASKSGFTQTRTKRLLEFDDEKQSITLPLEHELKLSPLTSRSLVVNKLLDSTAIKGSLEENLDLQTRDGNLACRSGEAMKLLSKSASARVTTFEEMVLSATQIILDSKRLYIPNGIQYFDSDPASQKEEESDTSLPFVSQDALRAYNLVAINGLLMAA